MSYSADTFVADEQPTTAKWNKLWSNDASFNDGTGIADNAILNRHVTEGVIALEKLNATVGFFAYRNAAWTTSTSYAKVTPDTELFDLGSDFASGTFTAPVDGVYYFEANAGHESGTSTRRIEVALYVNGAEYSTGQSVVASFGAASVAATISLTASQTVELYELTDVAVAGSTGRQTHFSGYLIGEV